MQLRPVFKTGILAVLLLVPVLVFLFLKFFGQNHYELRRYVPVQTDSTLVDGKYRHDTVWHKVPDFHLTAHTGKPFSQADLKGKIYVADFFFATCTTICPKMAKQMNRVQDMFRNKDMVKLISYTVNPAQDSVPVLAEYAKNQESLPGKWTFLTGDKKQIYELARKGYYLPAGEGDGGPDDFIHSDMLVLVDPNKNIRGYYHGTDSKDVDRLILEIRILLHEYEPK